MNELPEWLIPLKQSADCLAGFLSQPEPSLFTWNDAVRGKALEIAEFAIACGMPTRLRGGTEVKISDLVPAMNEASRIIARIGTVSGDSVEQCECARAWMKKYYPNAC